MKYKNKNNKTVTRADRVAGNFTTIPHRIIHDKRLSTDARLLLISILSDSDGFDFSRTGLCNRLGLTEYKLDNAIKELLKFGYIKKTKIHAQYFHYTICEYGNLNDNLSEAEPIDSKSNTNTNQDSSPNTHNQQIEEDLKQLTEFLSEREHYIDFNLLKRAVPEIKNRNDVFELKRKQEKEIKKNKIKYYKLVESYVNGGYAPKELKPKILKEVRRLITDEHKKPSQDEVNKIRYKISHNRYKNKVKRRGFDYETQLVDSYENPLD